MAKVPAFADIGKATKELLYGERDGVFQFEKRSKITTKTADGVEFALSSKFKEQKVEHDVTASYKADRYAVKASVNPAGKLVTTVTLTNPVPNLTVGLSGSLPEQSSGKLTVDYAIPNLTVKSATTLTSSPVVTLSAATGHKGSVFGISGIYDSKSGTISSWEAAGGYTSLDYQVAASLNNADQARLAYTHNVNRYTSVGAEVTKKLNDAAESPTAFSLGYARRLQAGSLAKLRLDSNGTASLLYAADVADGARLTHAVAFDVTDLNTPPKFGVSLDYKA